MGKYAKLFEQAQESKTLTNLTPKYREWKKKGDIIVGKYLSSSPVNSSLSDGTYNQYMFDTDDGLVKFAMGGAADSEYAFVLRSGNVYQVTYLGKVKISSKRAVNKFQVILIAEASDLAVSDQKQDDIPL